VAEQRLEEIVRERQREAAGVIAPRRMRESAGQLLEEHVEDFARDLGARGRAKGYVDHVRARLRRLIRECGWEYPKDVAADSFLAWRARQSKAAKTLNEYLNAAGALFNWMKAQGRVGVNPLEAVGRVETSGREKRRRRALSDEEVMRLLKVAGPRKAAYLAAVLTGLRRGELDGLRWGDVHLEGTRAYLDVRASTTKNKRRAVIWLRDDLAAELCALRAAGAGDGDAVFGGGVPTMEEFRADLEAAGIAEHDHEERRVDFHALRHTLATNLGRCGVPPRVAMEVMRHSDMRLTAKTYTDVTMLPMVDAMERLPRFDGDGTVRLKATGTEDGSAKRRSQSGDGEGRSGSCADADGGREAGPQAHENSDVSRCESSAVAESRNADENALYRTRTYDPLIKSQLLCQLS